MLTFTEIDNAQKLLATFDSLKTVPNTEPNIDPVHDSSVDHSYTHPNDLNEITITLDNTKQVLERKIIENKNLKQELNVARKKNREYETKTETKPEK